MSNAHIVVVLDRSGSMESCRTATVDGFDEFINKQKQEPGQATLTLVQFDDEYEVLYDDKDVKDVPSIKDVYQPRGYTALLDAIGKTIQTTKEKIVIKSKSQQPDRILCVIVTDGYENASKEYTRDQIVKMIREQETSNWEFIFLSANLDAIAQATNLGIKSMSAACYATGNEDKVWLHANNKVAMYRSANQADLESIKTGCSAMFTEEDRADLTS